MKHLVSVSRLSSVLLLLGSAVAVRATTISFTSTTGGGDITTGSLGATAPIVASLPPSAVGLAETFDTLTITGAPSNNGVYHPVFLSESYNVTTKVLTMMGTINGCPTCGNLPGLTTSSALATIQLNTGLTANATGTGVSVNQPSVASITSITLSPTLLSDLGLSGANFTLSALGNISSSCCTGGLNYQNQSSGTLTFTSTVPEPSFLPLTALVLGLGFFVLRKRKSGVA